MARSYSVQRIKQNRSYTIEEAADCAGVTLQTVRQWIKQGLPAMTEKRPYLILGWDLRSFLAEKHKGRKMPLKEGEFYCLSCRCARKAAYGLVEHVVREDGRSILKAFCEVCEASVNRFVGVGKCADMQGSRKGASGHTKRTCQTRPESSL